MRTSLVLAALGAAVILNIDRLGTEPWQFRPGAVRPHGALAPLVRAADRQWDPSLLRSVAMVAGIGVPILVQGAGADPAVIGAVGMLAGFCGTLLTPMAANFNIVPAALLELKDQYGVIRMQVATAIPLFACNVLILYFAGYAWSH